MYRHRREILLIYQDSHLLDKRSRRVILARVEEFIGMFERIITDAAWELRVPLPHPHLSANMLTFLPVMIALRGWSLKNDLPPGYTLRLPAQAPFPVGEPMQKVGSC